MADPFNILFLCTGNSARSIMAEAILNKLGAGKFRAYSAGSQPKGRVNPHTIQLLQSLGYETSGFRSKSWNEFARPGAPALDFVFTVCDNAAGETCPVWPGQPMTAHWGIPDPADAKGSPAEIALAFKDAYRMLHQRIGVIRLAERAAVVRGGDLHRSASARWPRRRVGSASHVRTACVAVLDHSAHWCGTMVCRSRRDLRPLIDDLRLCRAPARFRCLRRWPLHHGSLLVHGFDFLR